MSGDGEIEYESDPEEAKMSLKMRRRDASDDEVEESHRRVAVIDSDGDSDGQGGAAVYDDEDDDYYDEEEEEFDEVEVEVVYGDVREIGGDVDGVAVAKAVEEMVDVHRVIDDGENRVEVEGEGEGEKKENEPFAVPTSGAFYMHDDRFRDNAAARNRRTFGGRKLWESKDEYKWGHDKFEEMNMQDRHYEEGRRPSKVNYRGRGRGRGAGRGIIRGNRMRGYDDNNSQNLAPKEVRGRGPRRYQPLMKSKSESLPPQNRQSAKFIDKTSNAGFRRIAASSASQNAEFEAVPRKVASNLNSASPPFYPSGSSTMTQKKEVQAGNQNRNSHPLVVDQNFSVPHSNTLLRGKNSTDSIGMDKLHIDDSGSPSSAKPINNMHLPFPESSSLGAAQMPQSRAHGRVVALSGSTVLQPPQSNNHVNKVSQPAVQGPQRTPVHNRGQDSLQTRGQHQGHRSLGASEGSPPEAGTVEGAGMGSLVYAGAQVMGSGGNVGAGHGDKNLPAFFPVMQFGPQHPGGLGVPVGMAYPGYVAQPNGAGNSEMTWLPVLASAAGAMGATYCPPYLAVDGTYHSRPTGQTSALPAPSKDNNPTKPNNEVKPQQRSEVANDEFSHRQNKPRRYSEMNFSQ